MPDRTASELLRELAYSLDYPLVRDALVSALPALIALVEQAERFGWDSHMRAALADLRRELGGGA